MAQSQPSAENPGPAKRAKRKGDLTSALREDFRGILIQGRWLLVVAQTVASAATMAEEKLPVSALIILAALLLYNTFSLAAVYRVRLRPRLLLLALTGDLLLTGAAAWQTGGIHSPFLGQCYLIIFAGALLYDLRGGIIVGLAASTMATALALFSPLRHARFSHVEALRSLASLIPYYLLAGAFAGALVQRIRGYIQRDYDVRLREEANRRELELARAMQTAALPEMPPDLPGLDFAVIRRTAAEVGGDFLIFLTPEQECKCTGIVIGDVSGKGIPAALASTSIAHLLPWLHPMAAPKAALQSLNEDLLERLPPDSYATMIFAELDGCADTLRLWTAGHPPAIHYRARERRATGIETSEMPLGMFPGWDEVPVSLPWEEGDALLLYTDGISEARNAAGELFTSERLAELLTQYGGESAEGILGALQAALEAWGVPTDDVTVVAAKRRGVRS